MKSEEYPKGGIWEIFADICSVPHPSGHEEKLAAHLEKWAAERGFSTRRDAAGNLLIEKPASSGSENLPRVIMQGHLDMVPCSADGKKDFLTEPVEVLRTGDFLHTGGRSTLGADNGIGVALALNALAAAPDGGPLAVLLTVEEETGLTGAGNVSPEFLDGVYLLNMDSEIEGTLVVGCAGGARLRAAFPLEWAAAPENAGFYELRVSGLRGGHSGSDIDKKHGNAVKLLAEVLAAHPEAAIGGLSGGKLANVIPDRAVALLALCDPGASAKELEQLSAQYRAELEENGENLKLELLPAAGAGRVWSADCARRIVTALCETPSGAISFDMEWNVPAVSNNLAAVASDSECCRVLSLQRAQCDREREELSERLKRQYEAAGAVVSIDEAYPGWMPDRSSGVLSAAERAFRKLFGKAPQVRVMHAGLECGIFYKQRPELQMLSFGPDMTGVHSVNERVSISGAERVAEFLNELLTELRG